MVSEQSEPVKKSASIEPRRSVSALLGIRDLDEEVSLSRVQSKLVDMLVYGITGSTKTPLLASAKKVKELNNPIFVDIESGGHAAIKAGIEVIEFPTYHSKQPKGTRQDSLFKLVSDLKKIHKESQGEAFNCLLIDGWTEIYDILHEQVVSENKPDTDKEVGTQNNRLRTLVRIKKLNRLIRSIPVHIISTAREYTFTNETGTVIEARGPQLSTSAAKYVAAQSDIVARLRFVGTQIVFSIKEDSVTIARDRFYLLPDQIKMSEPSLEMVWKYIRGDEKRK